jgi:AhpD family alkylhydroperoxidase
MTPTTASETAPSDLLVPAIRLAVDTLSPAGSRALDALDAAVRKTSLEPSLLELVRLRASQINSCGYCVDMHSRDAMADGETERRLFALPAWRETPFFTAREHAALELTEAVTRLADSVVSNEVFERAAAQFSDQHLADLIWTIAVINTWNRLGATAHPWPLS